MTHLTYAEAIVVGFIQGVTELFPVSSLGHNVLIPALIGGSWASDLNVAKSESPYLAFIVGLHVATAIGMIIYFWRDWVRIIGGFFSSLRDRRVTTTEQRLAWMIILATIPVGIVGLFAEHAFRVIFGKAVVAAWLLMLNGVILYAGERWRPAFVEARRPAGRGGPGARGPARCHLAAGPGHRPARAAGGRPARVGPSGRPAAGARRRDPGGQQAGPAGIQAGGGHRRYPDPGAAGRHQPGRGRHGRRHVPRPVPRGCGPVLVPAVRPGHPGRGRAQGAGPAGSPGQRHPRPDPGRELSPGSAPTCRCGSS